MIYDKIIHGKFIDMRSITLEDVEFSYNIRADKKNRETVGQLAKSVEDQKHFIEWQMKQPGDYYFVVLNKSGEKVGLIGVYDIHDGIGEIGREVNQGEATESMEAEVLIVDFARDILKLRRVCSVIYLHNRKHICSQRKKGNYPLKIVQRSGIDCAYYENDLNDNFDRKTRELLNKVYDGMTK